MINSDTNSGFLSSKRSMVLATIILAMILGSDLMKAQAQQMRSAGTVEPPIGSVVAFAGPLENIPANWLVCDGSKLSRSDQRYRSLFLAIGPSWGGDGTTYFYLPDLMGRFLRGVDKDAKGNASPAPRDPGRDKRTASNPGDSANPGNSGNEVGSMQDDAMQNHRHTDSGHNHATDVSVKHDPIAKYQGEEVASGTGARVQANNGSNGFLNLQVSVRNEAGKAEIGDPTPSDAGPPRVSEETRPKNAYVYWIIRYK